MALQDQAKLTYEDFVLFPDDGKRRELIDGQLHVTPSPLVRHQVVAGMIYYLILSHLEAHGGGQVFIAPLDVLLSDVDIVEPDVIFVSDSDSDVITTKNLKGPPTLLVEVLSDARRDRGLKRDLYGKAGVAEYWIVDAQADRVEIYRSAGGRYGEPEILTPGETFKTKHLPGLEIDLTILFKR